MVAIVNVVRIRKRAAIFSFLRAVNAHQAVRIFHRPWTQREGVKCGEYRRIHTNSQSQSEDGRCRKPGILLQHTQTETPILDEAVEERSEERRVGKECRYR